MTHARRLLDEIHGRSLWQVLGVYLGFSWIAIQVADHFVSNYLLPGWVYRTTLVLLLLGLPTVLGTAVAERGVRRLVYRAPGRRNREASGFGDAARAEVSRSGPVISWRNTLVTLALAFALLGIAAGSYTASRALGIGPAAPLLARGDLGRGALLVLADAENRTADPLLGSAMTEALRVDLSRSGAVRLLPASRVRETLRRMEREPGARLDAETAREVAVRDGAEAVVVASATAAGRAHLLAVRVLRAETGEELAARRETAVDADHIIGALDRLSRHLRAHIGESLAGIRASPPLPTVTTSSLEALELYARAQELFAAGRQREAIPLVEGAVVLDTAFALAYRALAIFHGNLGDLDASQAYADRAHRFGRRLPEDERLLVAAAHHAYRGYSDSAAHYYRLLLARDPYSHRAANNLGDVYEFGGAYEEALRMYRLAASLAPEQAVAHYNLAGAARTLGRHALAESTLVVMRRRFPDSPLTAETRIANAFYAGRLDRVERTALEWAGEAGLDARAASRYWRALVATLAGRTREALALSDSAARLYRLAGRPARAFQSVETLCLAAWAAGEPRHALPHLAAIVEGTGGTNPSTRYHSLGFAAVGYALADSARRARAVLAAMDSLASAGGFRVPGVGHLVRAVLALREDRPGAAVEHLGRAREADFGSLPRFGTLLLGDAYAALGRPAAAVERWEPLTDTRLLNWKEVHVHGALRPLAHERLGRVYLVLGDTASARRHLATLGALWKHADAPLQPRVSEGGRLLEKISPSPGGE